MCKLPNNPDKIHGPGHTPDDRYVPLGSLCGYFRYVQGEAKPRHDIDVCCEVEDDSDGRHPHFEDEHAQCVGCNDCKFPQKVADECCKVALGREEETGRYGNYGPKCRGKTPVCCKCDEYSYTCIGEGETCDYTSCAPKTPAPTPKYCNVPDNPNKIHGWKENDDDKVVELGEVCGYFKYVGGFEKPRHGKSYNLDIIVNCCQF